MKKLVIFLLFQSLFKSKHAVKIIILFRRRIRILGIGMHFVKELYYVEAASVHIEMNIPLLKIRRHCLPDFNLRMPLLNFAPCGVADSFAVLLW